MRFNNISGVGLVESTSTGTCHRDDNLSVCCQGHVFRNVVIDCRNLRCIGRKKRGDGGDTVIGRLSPVDEKRLARPIQTIAVVPKNSRDVARSTTIVLSIRLLGCDQTGEVEQRETEAINE